MNNILELSSFLKEGYKVSTCIGSNTKWHENVVYKITENSLRTSFLANYLDDIILPGTSIALKFSDEFYEYQLKGVVSYVKVCEPSYVNIEIKKTEKFINTRAFKRYDIFLASSVKFQDENVSYFSIITNISLGGLTFISNQEFNVGSEASINIKLPKDKLVLAKGEVIRKNLGSNVNNYGFRFSYLDVDAKNSLNSYMSLLDGKWSNIEVEQSVNDDIIG